MTTTPSQIVAEVKSIFSTTCNCSECSSGISPISYFFDLLTYSYKNLSKKSGSSYVPIGSLTSGTTSFFKNNFYQNFEDYPINCKVLNKKITYLRLAVDSLLNYRESGVNSGSNANYSTLVESYLDQIYTELIGRIGLTNSDLAFINRSTKSEKEKKAKQLGLAYSIVKTDKDIFDYLTLTDSGTGINELTETNIEILFGVEEINLTRSRLNSHPIFNVSNSNIFINWDFDNIIPLVNTDKDGVIDVKITYIAATVSPVAPPKFSISISILRDASVIELASGILNVTAGTITSQHTINFAPQNNSGLSGTIIFNGFNTGATTRTASFSLVPMVLCWKMRYILSLWEEGDKSLFIPVIEPNIIGLNDFNLNAIGSNSFADSLTNLYNTRQTQLNNKRSSITTLTVRDSWSLPGEAKVDGVEAYGSKIWMISHSDDNIWNYIHEVPNIDNDANSSFHQNKSPFNNTTLSGSLKSVSTCDNALYVLAQKDDEGAIVRSVDVAAEDITGFLDIKSFISNSSSIINEEQAKFDLMCSNDSQIIVAKKGESRILSFGKLKSNSTSVDMLFGSSEVTEVSDGLGNQFVVNTADNYVSKFNKSGSLIWRAGFKDSTGDFVGGLADGQFLSPTSIAYKNGVVLVLDNSSKRVQQLTDNGKDFTFVSAINIDGNNSFTSVAKVRVDKIGNLYSLSTAQNSLRVYDSSGLFKYKIGKADNTSGSGDSDFNQPKSLFVDNDLIIYVADAGNQRIQIFDSSGAFRNSISTSTLSDTLVSVDIYLDSSQQKHLVVSGIKDGQTVIHILTDFGVVEDTVDFPIMDFTVKHACIDTYGRVVVVGYEGGIGKIIWFDKSEGSLLREISTFNTLNTTSIAITPEDLVLDNAGNFYIANGTGKSIIFLTTKETASTIQVDYVYGNNSSGSDIDFAHFENEVKGISVGLLGDLYVVGLNQIIKAKVPVVSNLGTGISICGLIRSVDGNINAIASKSGKTYLWNFGNKNSWTLTSFLIEQAAFSGTYDTQDNLIIQLADMTVNVYDKAGKLINTLGDKASINGMNVSSDNVWLYYFNEGGETGLSTDKISGNISSWLNNSEVLGLRAIEFTRFKKLVNSNLKNETLLENFNITRNELSLINEVLNSFENFGSITTLQESELLDVLMMIHKRGFLYANWLTEERDTYPLGSALSSIFTSPLYFNSLSIPDERAVTLNPRLVPIGARRNFTKTLSTRNADLTSMRELFLDSVLGAENTALGTFIDVLVADSNTKTIVGVGDARKLVWLSSRLFVDFSTKEKIVNPRVSYFIQLLQGILTRIRTGAIAQFATGSPNPLDIALSHQFDSTWDIMGAYATWRSAMFVNFYPENYLIPSVRDTQSYLFKDISNRIGEQSTITPQLAEDFANEYLSYLKDLSALTPGTSIQVKIPQNTSLPNAGTKDCIYHFAISDVTRKVYYAVTSLDKSPDQQIGFWRELTQLKNIEYLVGAVEIFDEKKSENKLLLFVKRGVEANTATLSFLEFNISTNKWTDDIEDVTLEQNLDKAKFPNYDPKDIKFPFDKGGFNIIMEESPEKVRYKDRFMWDAFNRTSPVNPDYPLLPAFALSIWWSDVILFCFFDYSNKILVVTKDYASDASSNPLFVKNSTKYSSPTITQPKELNFEPKALVRVPAGSNVSSSPNLKFALIGVDRGVNWEKSTPTYILLNQFGERIIGSTGFTSATGALNSLSYGGFYYDSFTAGSKFLYTFWYNGSKLVQLHFVNAGFALLTSSDNTKTALKQISQSSNLKRCIGVLSKGNQLVLSTVSVISSFLVRRVTLNSNFALSPYNLGPAKLNLGMNASAKTSYALNLTSTIQSLTNNSIAIKNLIAEGYYFIPILIANQLARDGFYPEALDYYRLVYDYTLSSSAKKIYPGLKLEEGTDNLNIPANWLYDPYNPHSVALGRTNAYTKYTVACIVKTMLDYADDQYSQDTVETVNIARNLYLQAQALILDNGLIGNSTTSSCATTIAQLNAYDSNAAFSGANQIWLSQWYRLKTKVGKVAELASLKALCDAGGIIPGIFTDGGSTKSILSKINQAVDDKIAHAVNEKTLSGLLNASLAKKQQAEAQQLKALAMRNTIQIVTKKEAAKKAEIFANIVAVEPAKIRTGVTVELVSTTAPTVLKLAPIRLETLRQAPAPVSVRLNQIETKSTSFTFTNKQA